MSTETKKHYCLVFYSDTGEHFIFNSNEKEYKETMWQSGSGMILTDALEVNGFRQVHYVEKDGVTSGIGEDKPMNYNPERYGYKNDIFSQAIKGIGTSDSGFYGGGTVPHGLAKIGLYNPAKYNGSGAFSIEYVDTGSILNDELKALDGTYERNVILYHRGAYSIGCLITSGSNDLHASMKDLGSSLEGATVIITSRAVEQGAIDESLLTKANLMIGKHQFGLIDFNGDAEGNGVLNDNSVDHIKLLNQAQHSAYSSAFIRYLSTLTDSGLRAQLEPMQQVNLDRMFEKALDEQKPDDELSKLNVHIPTIDEKLRTYIRVCIDKNGLYDVGVTRMKDFMDIEEWHILCTYMEMKKLYNSNELKILIESYSYAQLKALAEDTPKWQFVAQLSELREEFTSSLHANLKSRFMVGFAKDDKILPDWNTYIYGNINFDEWTKFFDAMAHSEEALSLRYSNEIVSKFTESIRQRGELKQTPVEDMKEAQKAALDMLSAGMTDEEAVNYRAARDLEIETYGFVISDFSELADRTQSAKLIEHYKVLTSTESFTEEDQRYISSLFGEYDAKNDALYKDTFLLVADIMEQQLNRYGKIVTHPSSEMVKSMYTHNLSENAEKLRRTVAEQEKTVRMPQVPAKTLWEACQSGIDM